MNYEVHCHTDLPFFRELNTTLYIQPPLPFSLSTLPILVTTEGQGSGRQGPSPLAPPEPSPNE